MTIEDIHRAIFETSSLLRLLPFALFMSIDYKAISGIIGAVFADKLAQVEGAMVNPIEKGHPDIIPETGANATEQELRNYPLGLEVKCTIGNVQSDSGLTPGRERVDLLTGINWQAHHREVKLLLGLVWDFADERDAGAGKYPIITGVFFSDALDEDDWGTISGTTGRNTKVSGMRTSGKEKMGRGWVAILDDQRYLSKYQHLLRFALEN